jgi:hypothetical protein
MCCYYNRPWNRSIDENDTHMMSFLTITAR